MDPQEITKGEGKTGGTLAELRPTRLLEVLGQNEATGCLLFNSKEGSGKVYFDAGVAIAAEAGKKIDKAAIALLFEAKDGYFLYEPNAFPTERRMPLPISSLLEEFD